MHVPRLRRHPQFPVVGRFPMGGYSFEIVPTAMREYKNNPSDIGNYYLKNFNGDLLPLDSVVSINEHAGPNVLNEFSQLHAAMFTASVGAGHTLGESLSDLETIVKTKLPKDIQVDYAFQSREYIDSQGVLLHAFIIAIVHACTIVIVHACTAAIVLACTIAIVNACTIATVHACTIAIVHACTMAIIHCL